MLKQFCKKRYSIPNIVENNKIENHQQVTNMGGATPMCGEMALDTVGSILFRVMNEVNTKFMNGVAHLGCMNSGEVRPADLVKVQMDTTLSATMTGACSAILATLRDIFQSVVRNIHS